LSSRSPKELSFFCWKAETIAHSFHGTKGSNFDVNNDVLASQQYQKSANNIKNQQPTISKIYQQYQEPTANNVKNQPSNQLLPTNQEF
jgi:hypothetical protein